ncbi:MAG: polyribonucleotide nucleotidyltransferase, partial [Candidatus Omnitrophica bacterium]|nr:polyribonucleotide nucleotidyltransferase [Candidatus Omnitrophota bacterium]
QVSTLDLVLAGTKDGVTMIESEACEITEERMVQALEFGFTHIKQLCEFQDKYVSGMNIAKLEVAPVAVDAELRAQVEAVAKPRYINEINQPKSKEARDEAIKALNKELVEKFCTEESGVSSSVVKTISHDIEAETVRELYLSEKKRVDGRKTDEIRDISCEVGVLPRTHGSALFTRGQTQSLGVVTLGTSRDEQLIESYEGKVNRRFMLHYNFPAFSVGEVKPMRGPGRREVGHGKLAWRGLNAVIPSKEEFPYTIRLVSEILESNGSSSMASICSGSLALMDAGVPSHAAVSGIAMGLIKDGDRWTVLSDIAGVEDHLGDMDFKVAGTSKGITTLQLDIKLKEGLDFGILVKALEQAKNGRAHILDCMNKVISQPRAELSAFAPQVTQINISVDKISELIGPGGKMIRKITAESGAEIEIEDSGKVKITARNAEQRDSALQMIRDITKDAEVGKVYAGTVKRIMPFGAFCEIFPGREGLCHVSELSDKFVKNVEDVVKVGDQ